MPVMAEDWQRLAAMAARRRAQLDLTQIEVAQRGPLSLDRVQAIEGAKRSNYRLGTLLALERALEWKQGSVDAILAGGEPTLPRRGSTGRGDDELLDADADDDGLQDLVNRARRERGAGDDTLYRMLLRLQGLTEPPQESGGRADETSGGKQQAS